MKVGVITEIDGQIRSTYKRLQNYDLDWLLCLGSFGVWPDPKRMDRGTRRHSRERDFSECYLQSWKVPIQTLFIEGVHDDHAWLNYRKSVNYLEILPGCSMLANGYSTLIGDLDNEISVVGLGKVFSKDTLNKKFTSRSIRHITQKEISNIIEHENIDIFMLHQNIKVSKIDEIINKVNPKLVLMPSLNTSLVMGKLGSAIKVEVPKEQIFSFKIVNNKIEV